MNVPVTDSNQIECPANEKNMIVIMSAPRSCHDNVVIKTSPRKRGPSNSLRYELLADSVGSQRHTQVMRGTITVPLGRYSCT